MGDNTTPGLRLHKELRPLIPKIEEACRKFGLDYYPIVVQMIPYDVMAEIASYGGFPARFPHHSFGAEYEKMARGYEYGQYRISEMVINCNPCYIYCMDSNTLVNNVNVISHAIGHNDFFKNNIFFEPTSKNMVNELANHGVRIRRYMRSRGDRRVTEFIDDCLRFQTLIDYSKAWEKKEIKDPVVQDKKNYYEPSRIRAEHNYMDSWVNPKGYLDKQKELIREKEAIDDLDLFKGLEKDIMGFLMEFAPLKPWQQDVLSMLREEAMYFAPQRMTKTINEGWASTCDYQIMCRDGLCGLGQKSPDSGIIEYADHKWRVLGGKYSSNPYKLGFEIFQDIEERWNKGRFGREYEECDNPEEKRKWDKKLNLGHDKIFEVRKYYNDYTFVQEFFTPDLCSKLEFAEYHREPNGKVVMGGRDYSKIRTKLLRRFANGGLPDIRVADSNHRDRGHLLLQHNYEGQPLYDRYSREVMSSLYRVWNNRIVLATVDSRGEEVVYVCDSGVSKEVKIIRRSDYEMG